MTRYRKPSYGAATRLARIVYELVARPRGWSFDAIEGELGISNRTLQRYVGTLRSGLVDAKGAPLVEVFARGDRRFLRLAADADQTEIGVFEAVLLYFTLTVVTFLQGTVLKDDVDSLWERVLRTLTAKQRQRLQHLDKKFYAVQYAVKDYRDHDETLDVLVRAVVDQRRLRVDYQGVLGEGKVHDFDAYTLVLYRGGLYLIGRSHLFKKVIWLAVERIRTVTALPERFDYPAGYSPERYTEGTFGIWDGPETTVEILLLNAETVAFLSSRRLHPTQKFRRRADGKTVLTMKVRGTTELTQWVLGMSPYVQVLKPDDFREDVAEKLRAGAELY